ncbi:MAG: DMT family transporter [Alphaproteobacteria bacterium]|nr:DMT family transporter [Alphaproteobacteria bacterium]
MGFDRTVGDRALRHLPLAQVAVTPAATAAHDPHSSSKPLLGIGLKIAATFVFTLMAAIARHLGETFPVGQIVFFRSLFAFIPIAGLMIYAGHGFSMLATKRPLSHLRRSFTGVCAMFTYFGALMYLPLADVTAISFASPLIVVTLAALMLGEAIRAYRWSAVAVGFVGVLIMVSPHLSLGSGEAPTVGLLLAILNAGLVAFTMIFIRMMAGTEPALAIAFYFQLSSTTVSALTLPFAWVTPGGRELALLILMGILGGFGQLFMTNSYRFAQASTLASFDYAAMVWAILFGWLFFSELPAVAVYVGAVIVIASGLFIALRERQLGLERKLEEKPL